MEQRYSAVDYGGGSLAPQILRPQTNSVCQVP